MSRYYFHREGDAANEDSAGAELPDPGVAREWAKREARILAIDSIKEDGRLVLGRKVTVTDESGAEVTHVRVGDAVEVSE